MNLQPALQREVTEEEIRQLEEELDRAESNEPQQEEGSDEALTDGRA